MLGKNCVLSSLIICERSHYKQADMSENIKINGVYYSNFIKKKTISIIYYVGKFEKFLIVIYVTLSLNEK